MLQMHTWHEGHCNEDTEGGWRLVLTILTHLICAAFISSMHAVHDA